MWDTSFFWIKAKKTRQITDLEFAYYVQKFFHNWDETFEERQKKGLITNLLKVDVLQPPIVDYEQKTVYFKAFMKLGEIEQIQYLYSAFFPSGNLVILFTPTSKTSEADFDFVINNISDIKKKPNGGSYD